MNNSESANKLVPKQALAPTPQVYDKSVDGCMEKLATTIPAQFSLISAGLVIYGNGCETGAGSVAIASAI